jgi:hypothetical protein
MCRLFLSRNIEPSAGQMGRDARVLVRNTAVIEAPCWPSTSDSQRVGPHGDSINQPFVAGVVVGQPHAADEAAGLSQRAHLGAGLQLGRGQHPGQHWRRRSGGRGAPGVLAEIYHCRACSSSACYHHDKNQDSD